MPLAKSAGKIMIDHTDIPFEALAAEIPSTPISVAVSKPSRHSRLRDVPAGDGVSQYGDFARRLAQFSGAEKRAGGSG